MLNPRSENWSRYWETAERRGQGTSFLDGRLPAVEAFWSACLHEHEAATTWLDLCSGNGATVRTWLDILGMRTSHRLVAVDAAVLRWTWLDGHPAANRIQLLDQTQAESIPLPNGHIDAVLSQFGFEYTDHRATLDELARLLRPGGVFCAVLHHADSQPLQIAGAELGHMDWLEEPEGWWTTALKMIEPLHHSRTEAGRQQLSQDPSANELLRRFNELKAQAQARSESGRGADILQDTAQVIDQCFKATLQGQSPADVREAAASWSKALADNRFRLMELQAAALAGTDWMDLKAALSSAGFENIAVQELRDEHGLWGWGLTTKKRA